MVLKLLILLVCSSFLWASSSQTCYSVQLTSFVFKKNSTYDFDAQDYPKQCQLISFGKINAVRCGCFENYKDAKNAHEDLSYFYPDAALVSTYKTRFKPKSRVQHQQKKIAPPKQKMSIKPAKTVQEVVSSYGLQTPLSAQKESETLLPTESSFLDDVSVSAEVALVAQNYFQAPKEKNLYNLSAMSTLGLRYERDALTLATKFKGQADYSDVATKEKNERTFVRLDELYGAYDFENDQILVGKSIRFWGALEARNITDGFNPVELRDDPFSMDKLGVYNASYSHFTQSGALSFIVKFYEQERSMAAYPYVYYYFPKERGGLPYIYKEELLSEAGSYRPTLYLTYSGSLDGDVALDYAFIVQNGYDSQRYYSATLLGDLTQSITQENAYLVNKISTYNTLVVGSTLYKLEALYSDVLEDKIISDYMHIGFGVEQGVGRVFDLGELSLLGEYYSYTTFDKSKRSDIELFEIFENDLFVGARLDLDDTQESSVSAGVVADMAYGEELYYLEYSGRFWDFLKLDFDYRVIEPSLSEMTAFRLMGRHERLSLRLGAAF